MIQSNYSLLSIDPIIDLSEYCTSQDISVFKNHFANLGVWSCTTSTNGFYVFDNKMFFFYFSYKYSPSYTPVDFNLYKLFI